MASERAFPVCRRAGRAGARAGDRAGDRVRVVDRPAATPGERAGGNQQPPQDPTRESEGGVATRSRAKAKRPQRYKVLLHNDDYTPMEFVVQLLELIFSKSPAAATQIMLAIHRGGIGVAGVYVLEIAETKVSAVHRAAEERGYPLRAGVEKE
jgi:ATP-dependent Clp protease adaptor protein ClpS